MENKTKTFTILFSVFALVQLIVPLSMIYQREMTLREGVVFHFKTRPIDPTDPFRGKYVVLYFENDSWLTDTLHTFKKDQKIYALLSNDAEGMAQIDSLVFNKPNTNLDYLPARVRYQNRYPKSDTLQVQIRWPFDRFYMEESKAYEAELQLNRRQRVDTLLSYAVVKVHKGKGVLEDVKVDDISLATWVEQQLDTD